MPKQGRLGAVPAHEGGPQLGRPAPLAADGGRLDPRGPGERVAEGVRKLRGLGGRHVFGGHISANFRFSHEFLVLF